MNKYLGDIFVNREIESLKKQIDEHVKKNSGTDLVFKAQDGNLLPYSYKDKNGKNVEDTGFIETIQILVAGIDKDKIGRAYSISVPKGIINEKNTQQCGAMWLGQTDVLVRIVKGYASEIGNLPFVKEALIKDQTKVNDELNKMEYVINWSTMTLQDAIDFSVLMTRTTESIQRFSDGTVLSPGGITGVGGDIDIAIITPEKGFLWLKKKVLKTEGAELDIDTADELQKPPK